MKKLLTLALIAAPLMRPQNTPPAATAPQIAAYVVKSDHPAFSTITPAPDFSTVVLVFGKPGSTTAEETFAITITQTDGSNIKTFVTLKPEYRTWRQLTTTYIGVGKKVASITAAPVTLGTAAPVITAN